MTRTLSRRRATRARSQPAPFAQNTAPALDRPVLSESPTKLHQIPLKEIQVATESSKPDSNDRVPLPPGWKSHIHPKGWIYYSNPDAKLVTDYHMEFTKGQQALEAAMAEIEGYPVAKLPASCELWIDYELKQGSKVAEKLFVDHEKRRLSPRAPVHKKGSLKPDGTWKDEDLEPRQQLQYEEVYWEYTINHPCHAALPSNAEEDAIAALAWYCQDRLLNSEDSIVPYSKELSRELLDVLLTMSESKDVFISLRNAYVKTHLVACILERVAGERLRQHYGSHDARHFLRKKVNERQAFQDEHEYPLLDHVLGICMTFLCFGTPYAYLRQIDDFFLTGVGRTDTITERWKSFVEDNVADWTNTNLVATVLISASVALLAIPGIDKFTRCLGIVSTLYSIASIVTGLLNVWQHQHQSRSILELTTILDFFDQGERHVKTDRFLALLLALPMVLLIWAAVLFAVSMLTFAWLGVDTTFIGAEGGSGSGAVLFGLPTAWVTTGLAAFLTSTVLASVLYFWAWKHPTIQKKRKATLR